MDKLLIDFGATAIKSVVLRGDAIDWSTLKYTPSLPRTFSKRELYDIIQYRLNEHGLTAYYSCGEMGGRWEGDTYFTWFHPGGEPLHTYASFGDHQCAVLGSMPMGADCINVNMGTGGQVAIIGKHDIPHSRIEPYFDGKVLTSVPYIPCGRMMAAVNERWHESALEYICECFRTVLEGFPIRTLYFSGGLAFHNPDLVREIANGRAFYHPSAYPETLIGLRKIAIGEVAIV